MSGQNPGRGVGGRFGGGRGLAGARARTAWEVARREFGVLTRTRTWRISTVLLVTGTAVGMTLVSALADAGPERRTVRVGHLAPVTAAAELLADPDRSPYDFTWVPVEIEAAPGELRQGRLDVVIDPPDTLIWNDRVDEEVRTVLRQAIGRAVRAERGDLLGVAQADLEALLAPVAVRDQFVSEGLPTFDDDDPSLNSRGLGLVLTMLTFVGLQVYGTIVVAGVVKEKADRVVEILLAHVRARELLIGKVAGVTAVASIQVLVTTLAAAAVLSITGAVALPVSIWAVVPLAVAIFVIGFGFYATLLAVAGSLVSRMEEGQFISLPVTLPLIGIYVVGLAIVLPAPGTAVARVLSLVPVSSPLVMPIRVAAGNVAAWELALSILLLLAATWWTVVLAARVYESTLLRTGTRTSWRDALRLARRDPRT
ncbi:MAG: ABC transporter permease [bacterium]|nr:ABC transporter permease [bacterium]